MNQINNNNLITIFAFGFLVGAIVYYSVITKSNKKKNETRNDESMILINALLLYYEILETYKEINSGKQLKICNIRLTEEMIKLDSIKINDFKDYRRQVIRLIDHLQNRIDQKINNIRHGNNHHLIEYR